MSAAIGSSPMPALPETTRRRVAAWSQRIRKLFDARRFTCGLGALLTLWGFGNAGYIHAKATLAQVLMHAAWERSLATGAATKPWPWVDTWPVAVLEVPRLRRRQYVLAGASGRSLAFGPALSPAAKQPGEVGRVVVSGHRDTHFAFLRELKVGDRIWLSDARGKHAYEITGFEVADARRMRIGTEADDARLALVTCWPFDAVTPGGPLRYVVEAKLVASSFTPT
jgi:sortase A